MGKFERNTAGKAETVAAKIRSQIVEGRYAPGGRLSTWDDMEAQFGVTRPTLTRAIDRLKKDGFLRATRSKGTYVTDRPPHLVRFGLVFSSHPSRQFLRSDGWNRFWQMLSDSAAPLGRQRDIEIETYYEVGRGGNEDEPRLLHELNRGRLGGLILVGAPKLMSHPDIRESSIPLVAIAEDPEGLRLPCVYPDFDSFVARAYDVLVSAGVRRVAAIAQPDADFGVNEKSHRVRGITALPVWRRNAEHMLQAAQHRGLDTEPYWHVRTGAAGVRSFVRLLLNQPQEQRPDGLIVADDNLVEEALAGILESGVKVPDQLTVVTHCNYPVPPSQIVPTTRVGFNVIDVFERAIETLQDVRRCSPVPPLQRIPALTEAQAHTRLGDQ